MTFDYITTFDDRQITELSATELEWFRKAVLIRRTEQRLLSLFDQGKLNGTVHTCVGQELAAVCVIDQLGEDDFVVSNHRGHGHFIARTGDVNGLIAEVMGRVTGVSGGMGGSQHLVAHRYLSNGIQGGMTPIAAGVALSDKLRGSANISVAFIGDGTLGEGILYEAMNLAGIWDLPLLIVVENNGYAQSTSSEQTFSGSLQERAEGFGLEYHTGSTFALEQLSQSCAAAASAARAGRPALLEINTYRLNPHSKSADNRNEEEINLHRDRDLVTAFEMAYPDKFREFADAADEIITAAVTAAEEADVLTQPVPAAPPQPTRSTEWKALEERSDRRFNELIYEALRDQFSQNDKTILIGEDIQDTTEYTEKSYGGAFKVTRDLSTLFPERVRNTPISEAAIVGVGTGLAISGYRPIVEIMFGDFMTLTLDQLLQHAAKFYAMYNGKVNVPLVVRTPMGGKRGYGPTHSQSIERFFLGIPGLTVVALNHRISPANIYRTIFERINHPALVIENKILYTRSLNRRIPSGYELTATKGDFPVFRLSPTQLQADVTVLCYGGMLEEAEQAVVEAFDELEVLGEVICPTLLHPYDPSVLMESVIETGKLVVVEEGNNFAAFGSEAIAALMADGAPALTIRRLGYNGVIPCSLEGEMNSLPGVADIKQAIKELVNGQ